MTYSDFDGIFTSIVNDYLAKGYKFFTKCMGGSQGEIAKVDLVKDNDLIRIYADREYKYERDLMSHCIFRIVVGRVNDEDAKCVLNTHYGTLWNNHLEEINVYKWYSISDKKIWMVSKEECIEYTKKFIERNSTAKATRRYFGDEYKKVVLPAVKRLPKMKSANVKDISEIYRDYNTNHIMARVRGNLVTLFK